MYNCELCEDRGYTESAWCLLSYHVHGWISKYDKTRGGCTTPCECGFDPEEEPEAEEPAVWAYLHEDWTPSYFELAEVPVGRGTFESQATASLRSRYRGLQQQGWTHNPTAARPKGWVTTDVGVWGLCEETGRTARVPKWLAGEPVEFEKYGADMSGKLLVRYTFMESTIHVLFTGYQMTYFRFAHPWDETYTTQEVMG